MARQYDKSADQLAAVIAAEPSNETAHYFLGFTREKQGLLQEAVNEFQRATALAGGDPSYLAGFGTRLRIVRGYASSACNLCVASQAYCGRVCIFL
ncbi:MAG TPA: hypothetical protein VEI52_11765 [Terriglobales bacterium]|nr:hypothetical protein [Terriglobales bacterium]